MPLTLIASGMFEQVFKGEGGDFAYWAVDTHIKAIFSLHCSE